MSYSKLHGIIFHSLWVTLLYPFLKQIIWVCFITLLSWSPPLISILPTFFFLVNFDVLSSGKSNSSSLSTYSKLSCTSVNPGARVLHPFGFFTLQRYRSPELVTTTIDSWYLVWDATYKQPSCDSYNCLNTWAVPLSMNCISWFPCSPNPASIYCSYPNTLINEALVYFFLFMISVISFIRKSFLLEYWISMTLRHLSLHNRIRELFASSGEIVMTLPFCHMKSIVISSKQCSLMLWLHSASGLYFFSFNRINSLELLTKKK